MSERCTLCPKLCKPEINVSNKIMGSGPKNASILFLGEAPGYHEDLKGRVFIGPVGNYLRGDLLPWAGTSDQEIYIDNAVRCRPTKKKRGMGDRLFDRPPSIREIENCRPYMVEEINRLKPKVIVASGNAALASILSFHLRYDEEGKKNKKDSKVSGILRWRGLKLWSREFNCWVIPIPHPSYLTREEAKGEVYDTKWAIRSLQQVVQLADEPRPNFPLPNIEIVSSYGDASRIMQEALKTPVFAFDVENNGNAILGCSFAFDENSGWYMPAEVIDWKLFAKVMACPSVKLMHNGQHEQRVMRANDIPMNDKYYDTMIAAHLVNENFEKGLKPLAWVFTSFGGYEHDLQRYRRENKTGDDFSKVPLEILGRYGAFDSVATYILYLKTKDRMKEENTFPVFSRVFIPMERLVSKVQAAGIRFDVDRAVKLEKSCDKALVALQESINDKAGQKVNIDSPAQLANVLYGKLKFKPMSNKVGKSGYPSVDKFAMPFVANQPGGEIAVDIMDYRYINKMLGAFVKRGLSLTAGDGRQHVEYNLTGTVTGRIACTIHNIPNDYMLRSLYTASKGCKFVYADLKGAEIVYLAAESGEEVFLRAFAEGKDVHAETARFLFNIPAGEEVSDVQRRIGKTLNFGVIYGMTPQGLAVRFGKSVEEANDYIAQYFKRLPAVKAYIKRIRTELKEKGYIENLFGLRRHLPAGRLAISEYTIARLQRQAVNSPIQGGAALCAYIGACRLDNSISENHMDAQIVHTVHDSVLVDTPIPEVKRVSTLTREAFETKIAVMPVKMPVDVSAISRWGDDKDRESRLARVFERVGIKV